MKSIVTYTETNRPKSNPI